MLFYSKMTILTIVPINLKLLKEAVVTSDLLWGQSAGSLLYPHFVELIAPLVNNAHFTDEKIESQRRDSIAY